MDGTMVTNDAGNYTRYCAPCDKGWYVPGSYMPNTYTRCSPCPAGTTTVGPTTAAGPGAARPSDCSECRPLGCARAAARGTGATWTLGFARFSRRATCAS